MWRKALLATAALIVLSIILDAIFGPILTSVINGESAWLADLNVTTGTFIYVMSWVRRIIDALVLFAVIWWALQSSMPQTPVNGKRDETPALKNVDTTSRSTIS